MFGTIGPVWDGNEVWLVVAGGATFAAFPAWYASMFSGLLHRAAARALLPDRPRGLVRVAREERRARAGARSGCGRTRSAASARRSSGASGLSALLYGVPLDSNGDFTGTFWDLFSRYTILAGLAVVAVFAFHGATFLTLRTTGELCERAGRAARRLSLPAVVARRRLPRLDGRRRRAAQRQGRLPAGPAGRDRDRARSCSRRSSLAGGAAGRSRRPRSGRSPPSRRCSRACIRA